MHRSFLSVVAEDGTVPEEPQFSQKCGVLLGLFRGRLRGLFVLQTQPLDLLEDLPDGARQPVSYSATAEEVVRSFDEAESSIFFLYYQQNIGYSNSKKLKYNSCIMIVFRSINYTNKSTDFINYY